MPQESDTGERVSACRKLAASWCMEQKINCLRHRQTPQHDLQSTKSPSEGWQIASTFWRSSDQCPKPVNKHRESQLIFIDDLFLTGNRVRTTACSRTVKTRRKQVSAVIKRRRDDWRDPVDLEKGVCPWMLLDNCLACFYVGAASEWQRMNESVITLSSEYSLIRDIKLSMTRSCRCHSDYSHAGAKSGVYWKHRYSEWSKLDSKWIKVGLVS